MMRSTLYQFLIASLGKGETKTKEINFENKQFAKDIAKKYGIEIQNYSSGKATFHGKNEDVSRYVIMELDVLNNPNEITDYLKVNNFKF